MFGEKEFGRQQGYPTPTDTPVGFTALTVNVPDNPAWWAIYVGLLTVLTEPDAWQQLEGGISREEAAEIALDILVQALDCAYQEGGCMDCCDEIPGFKLPSTGEFRVSAGKPQWSPGGDVWLDVPPPGGSPYQVPDPTPVPGDDDDARRCAAALRATIVLNELYRATFVPWGDGLLDTLTGIVKWLAESAPFIVREDVHPFESIVNVDTHIDDWQREDLFTSADLDEEEQELLQCVLFDASSVDANGVVTFDWEAATDNVITALGLNPGTAVFLLMSWIGGPGLNAAGSAGDATDSGCCDDSWCYLFDFTADDQGFTNTLGEYVADTGWSVTNDQPSTEYFRRVFIQRTGFTPAHITRVELRVDYDWTEFVGSGEYGLFCSLMVGATENRVIDLLHLATTEGTNVLYAADVDIADVDELRVYLCNGTKEFTPPPNGTGVILSLTVKGPGEENPFGEDNC